MPITINPATGEATISGDGGSYAIPDGPRTVTLIGNGNSVSGGTGPNTYFIFGDANGLTTGSGPSTVNLTDSNPTPNTRSAVDSGNGGLDATINGEVTITAGRGPVFVRGTLRNSTVLVDGANTNRNAYILDASGNVLQGSGGDDTIAIGGDASISLNSEGTDTYIFRAGRPGEGPRIAGFTAGQDNIAILVNPASNLGLTDYGLAPISFLTGAQFEQGATPTRGTTRFTYDPASGALRFTPNGSGSGESLGVARLPPGLNLQASQIFIANQFAYGAPTQRGLDVTASRSGFTTAVNPEGNVSPVARFAVTDTTINFTTAAEPGETLVNDPNGLTAQFIYTGANVLAIATQTAENVFVKSNSLAKVSAIQGGSGNDVLDGGLGSVFLTGGAGRDFFFTDARQSQFVWTTVTDFSAGEIVTLYGFEQGRDSFAVLPQEGAAGFRGVTLEANVNGVAARVTLSGKTQADFIVSFGQNAAGNYLAVNSTLV